MKPKPIVVHACTFSRALCWLSVITSSIDWFTGLSLSFLIGQSKLLWFWFYETRLKLALMLLQLCLSSLGRFPFERTDWPNWTFGRTFSKTPSHRHTSKMIYTSTPPEECEGLSCNVPSNCCIFFANSDESDWLVLTKRKCL